MSAWGGLLRASFGFEAGAVATETHLCTRGPRHGVSRCQVPCFGLVRVFVWTLAFAFARRPDVRPEPPPQPGATAKMLAEAGLKAEHVPPAYGGTMEGFDPAWFLSERT